MTSPAIPSPKGETQLEDCPFCGNDAYISGSRDEGYFVSCVRCFCCVGEAYDRSAMPEHVFREKDEAIAAWNRRSSSSREEVRREALEEAAKVAEQLAGTLMHLQPTINSLVQIGSHLETCRVIATAIRSLSQGE